MYSDKHLEFMMAFRDAAATVTRELPMGQGDMTGDTSGMGPYTGLFIFVSAGEDVDAGLEITMEHSDTQGGTYDTLIAFPATTDAKGPGQVIVKHPVPFNVKNWVRFTLSEEIKANILITRDVDKRWPGLFKE
jgi:hypothetical protein